MCHAAPSLRPPSLCPSSSRCRSALHQAAHPAPGWSAAAPTTFTSLSPSFNPSPCYTHASPFSWDATPLCILQENSFIFRGSSLKESMPDTGAGAAVAATTAGESAEGSRHRHRPQQGEAERPEPGAVPPQASSGVLGESCVPLLAVDGLGCRKRGQVKRA